MRKYQVQVDGLEVYTKRIFAYSTLAPSSSQASITPVPIRRPAITKTGYQ
jgi:hypothetical protein